jgi:hypothetical protein
MPAFATYDRQLEIAACAPAPRYGISETGTVKA